jgi:hypothetical protein
MRSVYRSKGRILTLAAKIYRCDERVSDRRRVSVSATVREVEAVPIDARIVDISEGGLRGEADEALEAGVMITVGLPGLGVLPARVVRGSGRMFACAFLEPLGSVDLARLRQAGTTVTGNFGAGRSSLPEPVIEKWPRSVRLALLVGMPTALWALLFAALQH